MKVFDPTELKKLYKPLLKSSGEDNGQVTIIGGSKLFHGAPLLSLKVASRLTDMVFFTSPEKSLNSVVSRLKASLSSFIWVPWEEVDAYIEKSDAVLIGPGFMRFGSEKTSEEQRGQENHVEGKVTREITKVLLEKFPNKRWVIDAGSLQVMDAEWIPEGAVLTPNRKEFELLFGKELEIRDQSSDLQRLTSKYKCTIILKGPETIVCSPDECILVIGGNPGMTKGGTGDVLAGLTAALLAKNDPFLAACAASYIEKYAADELFKKVGTNYNADDLADKIPEVLNQLTNNSKV